MTLGTLSPLFYPFYLFYSIYILMQNLFFYYDLVTPPSSSISTHQYISIMIFYYGPLPSTVICILCKTKSKIYFSNISLCLVRLIALFTQGVMNGGK